MPTFVPRLSAAVVLVLTAVGCTAQPRYPIDGARSAGGGFGVAPPRYPTTTPPVPAAVASPRLAAAPRPSASLPDETPPKAAPVHVIETAVLAPPTRGEAPREAREASVTPPRPRAVKAGASAGEVQVQPFETIYDVAERVRTPIRALVELNGLRPPYTVEAGDILKVPAPVIYTVVEGDTLFGVARRFGVDPRSLASLNDIPFEQKLRPSDKLSLPPQVLDAGPQPGAKGGAPVGAAPPAPRQTVRQPAPPVHPVIEPPPRPETASATESEVVLLAKGRFVWPLRGAIISAFGPKGPGQRNDGINIAAETGQAVRAAAGGVVVYAGNSIPAFGNLVLIKHPGGWATLYGNLGRITVSNNAAVTQGQEVGAAGVSGAVDRPQVHFEIRYAADPHDKAKPYDPALLLPGLP